MNIMGMKKNCDFKLTAGFTFVKLLMAVVVIGVLTSATIVFVNPVAQIQKANDAKRKSDLAQIQKALETFYQSNGKYPATTAIASLPNYSIIGLDGNVVSWGSAWEPYMDTLPKDPNSSKNYVYISTSSGQTYYIYASLNRGVNDPQACFSNGDPCSSAVANSMTTACGGNCNYGVSSPNVSP